MRPAIALPELVASPRGGVALPLTLDFSAGQTVSLEFALEQMMGAIEFFQSIYIKNRPNANPLTVTFPQSGYSIVALGNQQGIWPLLIPKNVALRFTATTITANAQIPIILQNIPYQPMVLQ